jgi:hypothetical protein
MGIVRQSAVADRAVEDFNLRSKHVVAPSKPGPCSRAEHYTRRFMQWKRVEERSN